MTQRGQFRMAFDRQTFDMLRIPRIVMTNLATASECERLIAK